jgi:2-C-methyl-D-erythritol 2,4-cyclodiphosphate synthase
MYKIGIGYDIHRLVKGRRLILGGVELPYERGLKGHSDADVILHAICDALLGAAGLGDIGQHFPNDDMRYKNISSLKLLKSVKTLISSRKYKIGNIDCTVLAEEPKIIPFRIKMIEKIAEVLKIKKENINIKATTNEGVGGIGRKEAIASFAIAILTRGE